MTNPLWSVGLMTGTVLDGNIDVALLRTDGESVQEFGPWRLVPYDSSVPPLLEEAVAAARHWNFEGAQPSIFSKATRALTDAQSDAVVQLVDEAGLSMADVGVIGFHGQTVLHRPPQAGQQGQTRQLGDGQRMASRLSTDVVHDFRSNDMRQGGQGAPLAPVYHRALLQDVRDAGACALLNLGGVGNISWSHADQLIAFDTGPANAPINDWLRQTLNQPMDVDGALASSGRVDEQRVRNLLEHPYFSAAYPKSLDRFDFQSSVVDGLSPNDGAATLTAFVAEAVVAALKILPAPIETLIVSGGGRRNPTLMRMLEARSGVTVHAAEQYGWRGDALEAEAFAFLAERSRQGLPISYPSTTGVSEATLGGVLNRA